MIRAACLLPVLAVAALAQPSALTIRQKQLNLESFELIYSTIRDHYWDPSLGGVPWKRIHDQLLPELKRARTIDDARDVMERMIARLGHSHLAIIPGDLYKQIRPVHESAASSAPDPATDDDTRDEDGVTGMEPGIVEGRALVISVEPDSPAANAGVRSGWEILDINGFAVGPLVSTLLRSKEPERELIITAALTARLNGPVNEKVSVTFGDASGTPRTIALVRIEPKGELAHVGYLPPQRVWFESKTLDGGAGYIRFNLFMDPERIMPAFEHAVRSFMKAPGIILDLRGNPGGLGPMSIGIAGWFIDRGDVRLGIMRSRDSVFRFRVNSRPQTYDGPLAVLVDSGSASTSEILAGGLQDLKRARIFGQRTAAAALPSVIIRLPNGDGFQYPTASYTSNSGRILEGNGVIPDVEVKHTREALLAGRDLAVDAALEWIRKP